MAGRALCCNAKEISSTVCRRVRIAVQCDALHHVADHIAGFCSYADSRRSLQHMLVVFGPSQQLCIPCTS
jgi:hypothetical protein